MKNVVYIILLISIFTIESYGQAGNPLGKEGYLLADIIYNEMVKRDFTPTSQKGRINDKRRLTVLRTLPNDTIYGCFATGDGADSNYYHVWSSVDKIDFYPFETPRGNIFRCYVPDGDLTEYVNNVFSGIEKEADESRIGFLLFVVKIAFRNGKFTVLNSKAHRADTSDIALD